MRYSGNYVISTTKQLVDINRSISNFKALITVECQNEDDVLDILKTLPIDVRVIGSDYMEKDFTGKQYCVDNNIEIVYNSRDHSFSTSGLRDRVKNA